MTKRQRGGATIAPPWVLSVRLLATGELMFRSAYILKSASIGAVASVLLLACAPAQAEWRTHIAGAPPILPSRFEPRTPLPDDTPGISFEEPRLIMPTVPRSRTAPRAASPAPRIVPAALETAPDAEAPGPWVAPLFDRRLSPAEREADIAPELIDAVLRIEPLYDPTRLYGTALPVRTGVSAGTAAMDNVFADQWQRADLDANVNQRVAYIAMAWHRHGPLPCDAFAKNRARGYNQPALTALSRADCAALARTQSAGVTLAPIVAGLIDVPTFAAPMPGARMSSVAFWEQRRADIARAEEDLKLRRLWHGGKQGVARSFARR